MAELRIILTGATGLVGEGVLYAALESPDVASVLVVGRKHYELTHPKLRELVVPDFLDLTAVEKDLTGYDACFYCAGISSAGLDEAQYSKITYDTPLHFAETLVRINAESGQKMTFCHISGASTDGSEKGRVMWARVKGRAENALAKLPFAGVYNFRPGYMKPRPEQRNVKTLYRVITALYPVLKTLFPNHGCTLDEVARAMIVAAQQGAPKTVLEVPDIKTLARS